MKKRTERKFALVLFVVCMLLAGSVYAVGFAKYTFQFVGVNVSIYPAAFLVLVGIVQLFGSYLPSKKQK